MSVRVRFAPSPTGYLHVGGARTAIYNYLFARKRGGTFILRIEDTDLERSTDAAIATILEGLEWMGITWDEGPYYQRENLESHQKAAARLVESGMAYRCFATGEELKEQREAFLKEGKTWRYDARYREMDQESSRALAEEGTPFVVRFKVPREDGREIRFDDGVYGPQRRSVSEIEDFALLRPDGSPLYNLSVVIDDAEMKISHVVRGQDHLPNTFKQILLYEALGYSVPEFAHLPLILAPDKSKLSKRKHGEAVSVTAYRDGGFIPHAFVNFLALLGWNPGDDREIMKMEELIETFDFSRVNRANAIFNFDVHRGEWTDRKATWMNGQYISQIPLDELTPMVEKVLSEHDIWDPAYNGERREWFLSCIEQIRQRFFSLHDFEKLGRAYFSDDFSYDEKGFSKRVLKQKDQLLIILPRFMEMLDSLESFTASSLEQAVNLFCEKEEIKAGLVNNASRVLITGEPVGPGIYNVLELIGRKKVLQRLEKGLAALSDGER